MMLVIPLFILQLFLILLSLINLVNNKGKSRGNKIVWSVIIVCISLISPVVYCFLGWEKKETKNIFTKSD